MNTANCKLPLKQLPNTSTTPLYVLRTPHLQGRLLAGVPGGGVPSLALSAVYLRQMRGFLPAPSQPAHEPANSPLCSYAGRINMEEDYEVLFYFSISPCKYLQDCEDLFQNRTAILAF